MADRRSITVDISWIDETRYSHAEGEVAATLIRAGWEHVGASETAITFAWSGPAADFDAALAQAQSFIGGRLVQETKQ
jgi:hypothetical protein